MIIVLLRVIELMINSGRYLDDRFDWVLAILGELTNLDHEVMVDGKQTSLLIWAADYDMLSSSPFPYGFLSYLERNLDRHNNMLQWLGVLFVYAEEDKVLPFLGHFSDELTDKDFDDFYRLVEKAARCVARKKMDKATTQKVIASVVKNTFLSTLKELEDTVQLAEATGIGVDLTRQALQSAKKAVEEADQRLTEALVAVSDAELALAATATTTTSDATESDADPTGCEVD